MTIKARDADYINSIFIGALQQGEQYVCLDTGKVDQLEWLENMRFFDNKTDARQYNYTKRTTDNEYFETLPILPLQQQLVHGIYSQQLRGLPGQESKDITIDISRIHFDERARIEIFTEEISRQLRDSGIKANLKQLQGHIIADDQQFSISGMCLEYGTEKTCTIVFEQDKDRAFLIKTFEWNKTVHLQKDNDVMLDLTEGSVRKQDAMEIRNMLRTEMENGNRFVSFLSEKERLAKEDFTVFKSSFAAYEYAYENSNAYDIYVVRSTVAVEKEMSRLLERAIDQEQNKQIEKGHAIKIFRDQDLSR